MRTIQKKYPGSKIRILKITTIIKIKSRLKKTSLIYQILRKKDWISLQVEEIVVIGLKIK
jgi:hypothetical protein